MTTYYQIAYLNDAISTTEETIKYYNDISSIMQRRLSQGVADSASVDQAQQAVLTARNNLINYQTQRKTAEQTLRNLLNLKPEEALKYCRMLEGKFKLYDNLKDIFDPKNKNQEYENIFEIQFKHSGSWGLEGSIQHSYWGPRNVGGPTNFGGWGGFGPTQYLYDSYDNADKRKKAFFITEYAGVTQTPPSSGKFWDAETGNVIEDDNLNFTMIRYADVLLMKAEALNSIDDTSNDKYDALNEVRGRAGLTSITAADNLNKEQFAEIVLEERLHELCCEHLRRWDLIRFGKLGEYMKDHAGVTIQPYHVLYPIPQAAVDANDAITENNEGY